MRKDLISSIAEEGQVKRKYMCHVLSENLFVSSGHELDTSMTF
jgi:hypothetical protein